MVEPIKLKIEELRSKHIGKLVKIQAKVIQASDVRPQVVSAEFECPECHTLINVEQIEKKFREPTKCKCGREGEFRLVSKKMVDAQRIVIEDLEGIFGANCRCRISVFLKEDLCSYENEKNITPGKIIEITGIIREIPVPMASGSISVRFDICIEADSILPIESDKETECVSCKKCGFKITYKEEMKGSSEGIICDICELEESS